MDETAAVFLPAPLFQSITNRTNIGIFFNVYDTGVLFPITKEMNASIKTVIGSPVLAATVGSGLDFNGLAEPVTIMLRLNQLGVSDKNVGGFLPHFFVWSLWIKSHNLLATAFLITQMHTLFTQNSTNRPPQCASWDFDRERMHSE